MTDVEAKQLEGKVIVVHQCAPMLPDIKAYIDQLQRNWQKTEAECNRWKRLFYEASARMSWAHAEIDRLARHNVNEGRIGRITDEEFAAFCERNRLQLEAFLARYEALMLRFPGEKRMFYLDALEAGAEDVEAWVNERVGRMFVNEPGLFPKEEVAHTGCSK